VLSGRGLFGGLITRPEEPYRLWCVVVCDLETSWMRRPWTTVGCRTKNKQTVCSVSSTQDEARNLTLDTTRWQPVPWHHVVTPAVTANIHLAVPHVPHIYFCLLALRPNADHRLVIHEISRSHATTHYSR